MHDVPATAPVARSRWVAAACAGLLLIYACLAFTATLNKCATYDEPLHAAGAWMLSRHGDFRANPEDPPLWQYWVALPHGRSDLYHDFNHPLWTNLPNEIWLHWEWCTRLLFQTEGNNGAGIIQASRFMMLPIAVALGGLLALFAWKLAGPLAALAAAFLFSFDANFLAHGPLVKNDVPIAFVALGILYSLWLLGQRLTPGRLIALAVFCGLAATTKFSGLSLAPIVLALLILRAVLPFPWPVLRWTLDSLLRRAAVVVAVVLLCGAVVYAMIWASYRFRFAPTPDPSIRLNTQLFIDSAGRQSIAARHPGRPATDAELAAWQPPLLLRFVQFSEKHRLFPQAWTNGLAYVHLSTLARQTYLLGEHSVTGWWYYFPLAMLFKTPLATLLALVGAGAALAAGWARRIPGTGTAGDPATRLWTVLCLTVPILIYGGMALSSNLNLGLRHMLPLYPILFLFIAAAFARAVGRWTRPTAITAAILALGLAVETLAAFPHYIAFFNAPAAYVGRLHLLSDSNLDWGQDLPLLARWQRQNPSRPLHLCYFGTVDPAYYGINYVALPGHEIGPAKPLPNYPAVWAISATKLQGVYVQPELRQLYDQLRQREPLAVLGHTIYLYEVPPR